MPQSDQGTLRQSWLSFYKTTRYHIFRTAVHQGQFLFFEIFDLPGYNFLWWALCFLCKCSYSGRRGGLANRGDSADQQSHWTLSDMSTWHWRVWVGSAIPLRSPGNRVAKLPEDNLLGCASENLGLSSKHVRELAECSCQSTSRSGELSGALTLSITSLRVNVRQWWNHDPSNAPTTRSAGTMTGLGFTPDCAITGSKKEINIKSECCALVFSFSKRRQLRFL